MADKLWHLITYDIRDAKLLRLVAKQLESYGQRLESAKGVLEPIGDSDFEKQLPAEIRRRRDQLEVEISELRKLKKQQRKIGRMERRFSSDGFLSGKERRRLEHAQDRASRRIARLKHNNIYRGSGNRYAHWNKHRRGAYNRHW